MIAQTFAEDALKQQIAKDTERNVFCEVSSIQASDPDSVEEWLEAFNFFSIYEVLPEILKLWHLNNATTANAKKSKAHSAPLHGRTVYAALC